MRPLSYLGAALAALALAACTPTTMLGQGVMNSPPPANGIVCAFNSAPPVTPDGNTVWVQCDANGQIKTTSSFTGTVTGSSNITQWNTVNLGSPTAWGTQPTGALIGMNGLVWQGQGNASNQWWTAAGVASYVDGWNVTEGSKVDAAYSGTGSASMNSVLKGIYAALTGTLNVGTHAVTQGVGNTANAWYEQANSGSFVDGWNATEGTKADAAYAGSGSASIVAALKGLYTELAGTLTVGPHNVNQGTPTAANAWYVQSQAAKFVDGWNATEGTQADVAYAGSGTATIVSALKGIYAAFSTASVTTLPKPTLAAAPIGGATVTTADQIIISTGVTRNLDLWNNSNSATYCIDLGAVATINGSAPYCPAGTITMPPGSHINFCSTTFCPTSAVHVIGSASGAISWLTN